MSPKKLFQNIGLGNAEIIIKILCHVKLDSDNCALITPINKTG